MKKAREIKKLYRQDNHNGKTLAKKFGVDPATIYSIINNKTWKDA